MEVAHSERRMGASEDNSMLEQDVWLLSPQKGTRHALCLNACFFCIPFYTSYFLTQHPLLLLNLVQFDSLCLMCFAVQESVLAGEWLLQPELSERTSSLLPAFVRSTSYR